MNVNIIELLYSEVAFFYLKLLDDLLYFLNLFYFIMLIVLGFFLDLKL